MPNMNEQQIKALISARKIFGITVDTAVFVNHQYNLRFGLLTSFDQVRKAKGRVLLSDIVLRELIGHLKAIASDTQKRLKSAFRKHCKHWRVDASHDALPDNLMIHADPNEFAKNQVQEYIKTVGAEIVPATGEVNVSETVLERYFFTLPPFEHNKAKKAEFPDAFALTSLEKIVPNDGRFLLCVSPDKGWRSFAAESHTLICVPDLKKALGMFTEVGLLSIDIVKVWWENKKLKEKLEDEIKSAFDRSLDNNAFTIDVSSRQEIEIGGIEPKIKSFDLVAARERSIINATDEGITFVVTLKASVSYAVDISLFTFDPIDRNLVPLEVETHTRIQEDNFEVTITVTPEDDEDPDVIDVDITKSHISVQLGDIEPFFSNPS